MTASLRSTAGSLTCKVGCCHTTDRARTRTTVATVQRGIASLRTNASLVLCRAYYLHRMAAWKLCHLNRLFACDFET